MHSNNFTLEERKDNFRILLPLIGQLGCLFKKHIIELNNLAKLMGYPNFLEYSLVLDTIPKQKLEEFLNNVDKFISIIHNDPLSIKLAKETKDWSILSIPAPDGTLFLKNMFDVPNQILELVSKYDPRVTKYREKIRIEYKEDRVGFGGRTKYDNGEKVAKIFLKEDIVDLNKSLLFVHELGHALDFLECIEKKLSPHYFSAYLQEHSAEKFIHEFIKKEIPDKVQRRIRYDWLDTLTYTLFEIDIFTNDQQDFEEAYARAVNRCYPLAHQKINPLYVFNERFITRPLGMLLCNLINVELYLKETDNSEKN